MTTRIYANTARVRLSWPVAFGMPPGSGYNVYGSGPDGAAVDFATPLNASPVPAWPAERRNGRLGFGEGAFGDGAFGFGRGGTGFGGDRFALGPFGFTRYAAEFVTAQLRDGVHKFAACPVDEFGNVNTEAALVGQIVVAGEPYPPTEIDLNDYDPATNTLTLAWTPDPRNTVIEE